MIILFPGLGANEKMFAHYAFEGRKSKVINFIIPLHHESLTEYCKRLLPSIPIGDELVFVGVSFGGILAQEISKMIRVKKIILISTIKSVDEKPAYISFFKLIPVYKIFPSILIKYLGILYSKYFTNKDAEAHNLFSQILMKADSRVIKYGIHEVLFWKQKEIIPNCIHIHGSADKIFPIKNIKADFVIDGGEHFMILQHHKEINAIINKLLG
jgi:pimeloyl-ACP methyl ester carboxylesterase